MRHAWFRRGAGVVLLALAVWACSYRLGAAPLLDDPNEAEYAEVAREMVEGGDWLTPHLNDALFLNKPPLTYWLIGLSTLAFGVNEFAARLPSACAALIVLALLVKLGTQLYDRETGLLAGLVLLATGGFFVESHEVRPDLWLTVGVVGSLVALSRLLREPAQYTTAAARWPLIGWQVALAVGMLAKGLTGILLSGLVAVVMIVVERRFDLVKRLLHPRGWWLFAVLIAPWHVVMSLWHPGFFWDYVVNQHLLFFFDRKLPRDSEPVSLLTFWGAFAFRLFPWTLFAPLAVWGAMRRRRRAHGTGDALLLASVAAVLLFFSAASSRMEHYSIPAIPVAALLIARLFREYGSDEGCIPSGVITATVVALTVLGWCGPFAVPRLVAAQEWLAPMHEFPDLARRVFVIVGVGLTAAAAAALGRRRSWAAVAIAVAFLAAVPSFVQGVVLLARVDSSAGMAKALRVLVEPDERVIYEAPVEYQNCAGFNYYMRRRLDLLRPPGFVAPTYLTAYEGELFISQDDLAQIWDSERVFLVTNPLAPRAKLDGTVPHPFYVVARDTVRWAVTNGPLR